MSKKDSETLFYPWYQAKDWTDLEQGDLLLSCPVLVPEGDITEHLMRVTEDLTVDIPIAVEVYNLVIMSQSCDLENDKVNQVLLCAYFPASNHNKGIRSDIRKNRFPALHMIEKCEIPNHPFERQVIDFRTIYTLPKKFIEELTNRKGERVRLLPPYKEHLSQSFARYFMRVGLPEPLEDE